MIFLIDNYDSFSYNLVHLAARFDPEIEIVRNDEITVEEVLKKNPDHILLSPGPGKPCNAGILEELVKRVEGRIPLLGVCLGHQGICESFGGEIVYAKERMHGKQRSIWIDVDSPIFNRLGEKILAARYHSLAVKKESLPSCLKVIAWSEDGEIMAVSHREYPIYGLQFHPESILTPQGDKIINNFLKI